MITFLSGGTGTPKLIQGFRKLIRDNEMAIVANSGDDFWFHGLYISPDIDTILYLFSDLLDYQKYWGIKDDTFNTISFLDKLGMESWFHLGDRDLGVHLFRTSRIQSGLNLSEITRELTERLNIKANIFPCSDTHIETRIITKKREDIHFQEFWVKRRGDVEIDDVYIKGIENAIVPLVVLETIKKSDLIVIGPSNPITSIGPIIKMEPIRKCLIENRKKCIAVSPIIGNKPVSGPTGKLMKALGMETSSKGVADIYRDLCSAIIIDETEKNIDSKITKQTGIEVLRKNILFKDTENAKQLAEFILKWSKNK